jgi:hypothetical protein
VLHTLPNCGELATGIRHLESYVNVQIPGSYWVELVFRDGEWSPAAPIPMPHGHATRLELDNLAAFALAGHRGERLRFTLEFTGREIRQVPGRHEWRATFHARVIDVCRPDGG